MKEKIMLVMVTFVIAGLLLLVGCNNQKQNSVSTEEKNHLLEVAQKAESFEDIFSILEKNDSEKMQMQLSKVDNPIVQQALLNYQNITTETLIAICEDPHQDLNLKNEKNKAYLINAISNAKLTREEELRIASIKEYAMQIGILSRESISAETLIHVLNINNNEFNWVINLENSEIKEHIYNHILKVSLTSKQKKQLENMDINYVLHALEARN